MQESNRNENATDFCKKLSIFVPRKVGFNFFLQSINNWLSSSDPSYSWKQIELIKSFVNLKFVLFATNHKNNKYVF